MPPPDLQTNQEESLMTRLAILLSLLLPWTLAAPAQGQSIDETKFGQKQAQTLHKYAASAYKKGFPMVAKQVWMMLLSEYDPDHAKGRAALGYDKTGGSWVAKVGFVYKTEDDPNPSAAKSLEKDWKKVREKVASEHKKMARQYDKAGRTDRSKRHYEKVIFFVEDDEEALAALNHHVVVEGLTGTDLEQTLYERSRKIEDIVAKEARNESYEVKMLGPDATHPFLEKAKVQYISVKTEHFTIRGDFEADLLTEAARNAERALRVLRVTMEGHEGFSDDPRRWGTDWAFFKDKDAYKQILNANSSLMEKKDLEFRLEHTSASSLFDQGVFLRVGSPQNAQGLYDGAVRNVAQSYSSFRSAGLREGIGHTFVGMFFNNNRAFVVDRKKQIGTDAGEEDLAKFSPNMDTWKDLALEAAWKLVEGTPASRLPLIKADKFPDDARIKSWSFCDYVVRRDPSLLRDLDGLSNEAGHLMVEQKFTEQHEGLSIAQLEKEWKDFWTGASPVLKAIQGKTSPLTGVSPKVQTWLKAFNQARRDQSATDVTWSSAYSGRCREHAKYLLTHEEERGPAREHTQNIELDGGTHLGDMFAQMAIVTTRAKKPKDVFKEWLHLPGYRDALINSSLRVVGLYVEDDVLVLDVIRGVGRPPEGKGGFAVYPPLSMTGVPPKIDVEDLGPELKTALERHGHGDKTEIGYPISLHHFGTGGVWGDVSSYRCTVTAGGKPVEGFIHMADGGENRRSSAPGMVVFYPLEPLRKGVKVEVVWIREKEGTINRTAYSFNT